MDVLVYKASVVLREMNLKNAKNCFLKSASLDEWINNGSSSTHSVFIED